MIKYNINKDLHCIAKAGVLALMNEYNKIADKHLKETGESLEALNGDDIDWIVKVIKLEFNLLQGNLTREEYFRKIKRVK